MARTKSLNFVKLNDELFASDAAIDPVLVAAKISTLKVEGKDVPAAEAPLQSKIAALGSLIASGDKTSDSAELIAANGQLASQVEQGEAKLTQANATISALQQKLSAAESNLNTEKASVAKLTAEGGTNANLLEASNKEVSRITREMNALNREISGMCLAAGCLDLKDESGKALAKDASEDVKLAAADKIPVGDKLKAYSGALNAAAAKIGISLSSVPSGGAVNPKSENKKLSIDEQVRQAKAKAKNV